jgi:hypothetical protein
VWEIAQPALIAAGASLLVAIVSAAYSRSANTRVAKLESQKARVSRT